MGNPRRQLGHLARDPYSERQGRREESESQAVRILEFPLIAKDAKRGPLEFSLALSLPAR